MLQGLKQGNQQVGQHDHRQGEDHDAHIPRQLQRFLRAALPQGARQGGEEGGAGPYRRHNGAEKHRDGDEIVGGGIALLPAPAEPGGEDGHGGDAQGIGRRGKEIDGVVAGGGIQVRRDLGAEGPGLQGFPDDAQQLGKECDQGHGADDMDGLVLFHTIPRS